LTGNPNSVELGSDSTVARRNDGRDIVPEALLLTHQRDHPRRACGRRSDMNDLQRLSGGHQ
jgi:hypothetical protein